MHVHMTHHCLQPPVKNGLVHVHASDLLLCIALFMHDLTRIVFIHCTFSFSFFFFFFFYKRQMHWYAFTGSWGQWWVMCMCTDLFASYFFFFEFFLHFDPIVICVRVVVFVFMFLSIYFIFIWYFECCVIEYLFETLNVVLLYVNVVWLSIYLRL